MDNLIDLIGKQLTPDAVNALSGVTGTTPAQTQKAIGAAVPALVGALAKKGGTRDGAQQILDMVTKQTGGGDLLGNLAGMLGSSSSSQSVQSSGASILTSLLGGDIGKIISTIASIAGIPEGSATSLLRTLAPMVLALLGKQVSGGNLNVGSLSNLLAGQTDFVKAAAPKGLVDALGISLPSVDMPTMPRVTTPSVPTQVTQRGLTWLWWVIGIIVVLVVLWYLFLR